MSAKCLNCNAVVALGLTVCNSCGKPLKQANANTDSFCSSCGNILPSKYAACLNCGHSKTVVSAPPPPNQNPNQQNPSMGIGYKNEGTGIILAAILGLFGLPGVGHMYIGRVGRGVAILIGSWILIIVGAVTLVFFIGIIFLVIYFVMFIWQILDVKQLCRRYNESIQSNNPPPW